MVNVWVVNVLQSCSGGCAWARVKSTSFPCESTLPIFGRTIQGVSESEFVEGGERMIRISLLQFLLLAALRLTNGKSFHIEQDLEGRDDEEWNYRDKVRLCQFLPTS